MAQIRLGAWGDKKAGYRFVGKGFTIEPEVSKLPELGCAEHFQHGGKIVSIPPPIPDSNFDSC